MFSFHKITKVGRLSSGRPSRIPRLIDVVGAIGLVATSAMFYQSYVSGPFGLMAEREFNQQKYLLAAQANLLDKQIQDARNLNLRISDEYLDLDLLEERARKLLGYTHPLDIAIER